MSVAKARSRVAVEVKRSKKVGEDASADAVQAARAILAEENIKAFIERTVSAAPPLSPEQRARLAQLLAVGPTDGRRS